MSSTHSVAALVAASALLVGCGEATSSAPGSDPTLAGGSSAGSSGQEWTGDVIPDGTYAKTATMADAKRLGLPRDTAKRFTGDDGKLRVELKIAGETWALFSDDDGAMTQGDGGTATYDTDGNWVTTSDSSGCPGCVATMSWTVQGDHLSLELIETTEVGDPVDLLVGRLVFEGRFARP